MRDPRLSDEALRQRYGLSDNRDWQLVRAREALRRNPDWESALIHCLYRPFDRRWCYFDEAAMDFPAP